MIQGTMEMTRIKKEWLCIDVQNSTQDTLILYYKIIQDLPDGDLIVCVVPSYNRLTTGKIYEISVLTLLEICNATYKDIYIVCEDSILEVLEFLYGITYNCIPKIRIPNSSLN